MTGEQIGLVIGLIGIAWAVGYVLGWVSGQADAAHEQAEFTKAMRATQQEGE